MTTALQNRKVSDLTTSQLAEAFEQRLVQDGVASMERGDLVEVDRDHFEQRRKRLKALLASA